MDTKDIENIRELLIRVNLGYQRIADKIISDYDLILTLLSSLEAIQKIDLPMKNLISLLINVAEKLTILQKEILQIKVSITNVIMINDKKYYYNYKLDSYLSEDDLRKIDEVIRRLEDIIKFLIRKILYLIQSGIQINTIHQLYQPQQVILNIEESKTKQKETKET
ncbi:MAG: hypothetical protein QXQ14_03675 [Candidatus Aenigmatarchaeota archaeon]